MEFGDEPLDFQIPDVVAPLVGYRTWMIDHESRRLVTSFGRHKWEPDESFVASCGNGSIWSGDRVVAGNVCDFSPSPTKDNHHGFGCGIYSYKDPTRAAAYHDPSRFRNHIWGEILMWGTVYEHEHGYRAQFACLSAVACLSGPDPEWSRFAMALAEEYDVGIIADLREVHESGRWNPITRTVEPTMSMADYLLDRSLNWPHH